MARNIDKHEAREPGEIFLPQIEVGLQYYLCFHWNSVTTSTYGPLCPVHRTALEKRTTEITLAVIQ